MFSRCLSLIAVVALAAGLAPDGEGRRYSTIQRASIGHLREVQSSRFKLVATGSAIKPLTSYNDYRAVLHAHAEDSSHTGGTRTELLRAAKTTGTRIVMLTDHVRPPRDFINDSWRGIRDGVLFIPGAEAEGFLAYPERSIASERYSSPSDFARIVLRTGGNLFLSHVEERLDFPTEGLDGLEIYNHHTDLKDEGQFLRWLRDALVDPVRLRDLERAIREYPREFFAVTQDYPADVLAKWDKDLAERLLTGISANDCHHNQGFIVTCASSDAIEVKERVDPGKPRLVSVKEKPEIVELLRGRSPGDVIANLDFDPYERSLLYVSTHILSKALDERSVREALRKGRAFVAHDWIYDSTGFQYVAERNGEVVATMGETVKASGDLMLRADLPARARMRLLHNGRVIHEVDGVNLRFSVPGNGVYRLEAWVELDGELRPWIYSNPIRVEPVSK
jgi:hypothetical protein